MDRLTLLNDKFITAKLPDICMRRPSLMRKLVSADNRRVVYFSAPAGYGKTVSARLWLASSGREAIWITLDAYDNTLYIFYKLFCAGILSTQPENTAMEAVLRSGDFASSPVEHTIRLLSELYPNDKKYAIVLDDFHALKNEEIRKSGLLVQKRLAPSFLTVILTRNDVKSEHISITGTDRTMVINASDLAFSEWEIRDYFAKRGRSISERESKTVYAVTGGWPVGVNALALNGQLDIEQSGGRILEGYIKTQIWDGCGGNLRDFMLKTCVADEMSPELCNRLTGRTDSEALLRELCEGNSFVCTDKHDNYCYHKLFLEFLRAQRVQSGENFQNSYRIAAEYHLDKGEHFNAFPFAIESGDSDLIARTKSELLRQNSNPAASLDDYVSFYGAIMKKEALEAAYEQNPYLYADSAWYYFLSGDAVNMEKYMELLRVSLPEIAEKFPQFIEYSIFVLHINPRSRFPRPINRYRLTQITESCNFDLPNVPMFLHMPYMHRSARNYCELTDSNDFQELYDTLRPPLCKRYEPAPLLLKAGLMFEQGRQDEALEAALSAQSLIGASTGGELVFCAYAHLASIYFAMGRNRKYAETIVQMEQYIKKSGEDCLMPNFIAFKTRNSLLSGNADAAAAWLKSCFVADEERPKLYKIFRDTTTAMAYIVLARYDRAAVYADRLYKLSRDFHRPFDMAEAGVLKACIEWASGRKEEAQETLKDALTDIQEYNAVHIAAEKGAAVLPILKKLTAKAETKYDNKNESADEPLDIRYLRKVTLAAYEQSRRHRGITGAACNKPVKLSKRQRQILALFSRGFKNADVAKELSISLNTVKSHCAAAYDRLDVNSAMDAVIKARRLGFIE